MQRNGKHGFTLVEMLIVVCVITILIGLTAGATASARRKAYTATATLEAEQLATACKSYRHAQEKGTWPIEVEGVWTPASETVLSKLIGGDGAPVYLNLSKDQIEDGFFNDPWGHPYQIKVLSANDEDSPGMAGEIQLKETIEVVVSFPNQFGRYYEFGKDVPYVDPELDPDAESEP